MSHHFDSPTAIADGRLNLCDVYAFSGPGSMSNLILTVNPDAGRSSATTFRPDALYEFVIASDASTNPDRAFQVTFTEPAPDGRQQMTVRYAEGAQRLADIGGRPLGTGSTAETLHLANGGSAWFGEAGDPFWGDGVALAQFLQGLAADEYRPEVFAAAPGNIFAGRNVTAIALQVPSSMLGGDRVSVWARIRLHGHAPTRQVSRMGNPMVRPLYFPVPGRESEAINAGSPGDDAWLYANRVREAAAKLAAVRGLSDPHEHASGVARAFLPDVLQFSPGQPAAYHPGSGNGRGLADDAFGAALSVFNGGPLGVSSSPHPAAHQFPYLLPPSRDEMPALADLFGLRGQIPERRAG
jgi:hypothetical protein